MWMSIECEYELELTATRLSIWTLHVSAIRWACSHRPTLHLRLYRICILCSGSGSSSGYSCYVWTCIAPIHVCKAHTSKCVWCALFCISLTPDILAYKFGSTLTHWPQFLFFVSLSPFRFVWIRFIYRTLSRSFCDVLYYYCKRYVVCSNTLLNGV